MVFVMVIAIPSNAPIKLQALISGQQADNCIKSRPAFIDLRNFPHAWLRDTLDTMPCDLHTFDCSVSRFLSQYGSSCVCAGRQRQYVTGELSESVERLMNWACGTHFIYHRMPWLDDHDEGCLQRAVGFRGAKALRVGVTASAPPRAVQLLVRRSKHIARRKTRTFCCTIAFGIRAYRTAV